MSMLHQQSDLGLQCLPRLVWSNTSDHYGSPYLGVYISFICQDLVNLVSK